MKSFEPAVPVEVIGNLVRTGFFLPPGDFSRSPDDPFVFLTVALLHPVKALPTLLQAFKLVIERGHGNLRLDIGGDGPERAALESLASHLGLDDNCRFLGLLDREGVRSALQKCDSFVLASRYESFGVVLGEAMACGKPVIATSCGGPEFVVTPETGVLVPPGSPDALADAMENAILRRDQLDPDTIRASVVERFGESSFVARWSELYSTAASG
jgi:glycosyltransferase involved in cell wall biosynthesis